MARTVNHQGIQSLWGDQDHLQVAKVRSFASLIFELLSEKVPTDFELEVFELILNLSIDHGPETPSALQTIEAAKGGKTISEAIAAGILQINDAHGGAIEPAMELFYRIRNEGLDIASLVKEYFAHGKRIAGYGHRLYKDEDPRAQLILNKLQLAKQGAEFIAIAKKIETEIEKEKGKKIPLNIDGAIAVALCTFGWQPDLGKAVFIIARTPGLCGQYLNNI